MSKRNGSIYTNKEVATSNEEELHSHAIKDEVSRESFHAHLHDNHSNDNLPSTYNNNQYNQEKYTTSQQSRILKALHALHTYNPSFTLTPDVIEIMKGFFDDLDHEGTGSIPIQIFINEMNRLDPTCSIVSVNVRNELLEDFKDKGFYQGRKMTFEDFCELTLLWKGKYAKEMQAMYSRWITEQMAAVAMQIDAYERPQSSTTSNLSIEQQDPQTTDGLHKLYQFHTDEVEDVLEIVGNEELMEGITQLFRLRKPLHVRQRSNVDNEQDAEQISAQDLKSTDTGINNQISPQTSHTVHHDSSPTSSRVLSTTKSFFAGGLAGIIAKSMLAPVDRVKIMFQVNQTRAFNLRNALALGSEIYKQDGFHALFRGNFINILRVVPYAGIQHSSFDYFKQQFHAYNRAHPTSTSSKLSNTQLIMSGSLAGTLSLVVAYPLDVVRARYTVQTGKYQYTNIFNAISEMYKREGLRSFSRGLVPSLLGTLPYTGIGFTLNENFKYWLLEFERSRHRRKQMKGLESNDTIVTLHPLSKFFCSYLAACIAQTVSYPMDTIRRRMQTDGFIGEQLKSNQVMKLQYTSVRSTARIILEKEGIRGLFKGVSVNWFRSPLATGISLTSYDILKDVMGIEKVGKEQAY